MRRPKLAWVGITGLIIALAAGVSADAATGSNMIVGHTNTATTTTTLKNTNGTALALSASAGHAPLSVGTNRAKVTNLNSDLLDGHDSSAFQRRVSGTCATGRAVVAVSATGAVSCRSTSATCVVVSGTVSNLGGGAYCPTGWVLGGGGFEQPVISDESHRDILRASRPSAQLVTNNGWFVQVDSRAVNNFQVNQPTTVYAVCLKVG